MPRILSVSYDLNLLRVRQLLLESEGYEVTSAEGFVKASEQCKRGGFDLLIIGHSIPKHDKEALIQAAQGSSVTPVLSLLRYGESAPQGSTEVAGPSRPDQLLAAVRRIIT